MTSCRHDGDAVKIEDNDDESAGLIDLGEEC